MLKIEKVTERIDPSPNGRHEVMSVMILAGMTCVIDLLYMAGYLSLDNKGPALLNLSCALLCLLGYFFLKKGKLYFAKLYILLVYTLNIFLLSVLFFGRDSGIHYYLLGIPIYHYLLLGEKKRKTRHIVNLGTPAVFCLLELTDKRIFPQVLTSVQADVIRICTLVGLSLIITAVLYYNETLQKIYEQSKENADRELNRAQAKILTLSGLLPLCSHCKKIRDDRGYWGSLESYIQENTDALISHGLCPDCMEELYGDEEWFDSVKFPVVGSGEKEKA